VAAAPAPCFPRPRHVGLKTAMPAMNLHWAYTGPFSLRGPLVSVWGLVIASLVWEPMVRSRVIPATHIQALCAPFELSVM
jgi:hypothetical protein